MPEHYPLHAAHHPTPISESLHPPVRRGGSAASGGGAGQPISDPLCKSVAKSRRSGAGQPISENPRQSAAHKGRGGRRPGAGAPRGNLNALKHGRRSRQFAELGRIVADVPEARNALLALDRRNNAKSRRAEETGAEILAAFYQRCKAIAEGDPSASPFAALEGPVLPARRGGSGPQRSGGAVEGSDDGLNDGLNDRPKALSAAQSKRERQVLSAALAKIDRELQEMRKSQTNNRPVPQQSDPKYEIAPD